MIKLFQNVGKFYLSKFEAAVKAMQESCKQTWAQKVSNQEKNQLWTLYKQATEGNIQPQMTTQSGTYPNMGSSMTSFRSGEGRQTAQGMTEAEVLKHQFESSKKENDQKHFSRNQQKMSTEHFNNHIQLQKNRLKAERKGSEAGSSMENERNKIWSHSDGKSRQQAQDEYIKLAKKILQSHNAHKYLKDL